MDESTIGDDTGEGRDEELAWYINTYVIILADALLESRIAGAGYALGGLDPDGNISPSSRIGMQCSPHRWPVIFRVMPCWAKLEAV